MFGYVLVCGKHLIGFVPRGYFQRKAFREQLVHYREWERNRKLMEDFHHRLLSRTDHVLTEEAPLSVGKVYM